MEVSEEANKEEANKEETQDESSEKLKKPIESQSVETVEIKIEEPTKETSAPEGGSVEKNDQSVEVIRGEITSAKGEKSRPSFPFKKTIFIVLIVVLVGALVGGGVYVYKKAMSKAETELPVTEEVTLPPTQPSQAEEEEAQTPTPGPKREELKVKVLNGSGVAGAADGAKEFLEGLGYQDIKTGNANSYDFEKTEIAIKKAKSNYLDLLTSDLGSKYIVGSESATLEEDSEYDAVVTVGKS